MRDGPSDVTFFCFILWLQKISLQIIVLRSRLFLTAGTEVEKFVKEEQKKVLWQALVLSKQQHNV